MYVEGYDILFNGLILAFIKRFSQIMNSQIYFNVTITTYLI